MVIPSRYGKLLGVSQRTYYLAHLIKYITHNITYHPPLCVSIYFYIYNILYITPPHLEEHVYT